MKPDFKALSFHSNFQSDKAKENKKKTFISAENIPIFNRYKAENIPKNNSLNTIAGEYPFLKGPYSSMYTSRPWTVRQYAGFSTAKESNLFYKNNLKAGQKGLSIAFDLPTHRGYDSDNQLVSGDVGKTGVAIDTVEDMKVLLEGIPLGDVSVSMTMNGAVLPILAFFIVAAEESGISMDKLSGTIQNDILKEFMVRNTYIYPPSPSMEIIADIFKFSSENMPKFNSISISGYHIQEAGAPNDIELAYTIANGLTYLKAGIKAGLTVDEFAPRLSFFWAIGMNHFMEVAKMRAARVIWARLVKQFKPKNKKSLMLRTHCQTSGWSLTAQSPYNNISRTCIEALSAVLGGTQSLHTNALDEAIALPTKYSAEIARNTQLYIQEETNICKTIDPYAGSYYVEYLTHNLIKKVWGIIQDIENNGGMLETIENGVAKSNIETAATKKQAKIDSGRELLIGINSFFSEIKEEVSILEVDNKIVLKNQLKVLKKVKQNRNQKKVKKALLKLSEAAKANSNLLKEAIEAARERATLGEISLELEKIYGRYQAKNMTISGVYINEMNNNKLFKEAKELVVKFSELIGRQPRIMVAKVGQDGHDRGVNIIATSFVDMGFDVDLGPLFSTPESVAKNAVENDVHIVGVSSLAAGHKTLIPQIIKNLKSYGRKDIMVIVGGVIPEKDYDFLYSKGVNMIFGSGSNICQSAIDILSELISKTSV